MGELKVRKGAELDLEVGTISELNAKRKGPALLFDEFKDYPKGYRVLTCSLLTPRRLAFTLGIEEKTSDRELVVWR
jgi:4-hydroxy-3-polyprenylbenzoate decarboxylase